MPAGRCTHCGFLCNPELFGCSEALQPCPKGRVYYCGQLCQAEDAEKHRARFHRRENVVVCRHFLRGHCAYGDRCWKQHPSSDAKDAPRQKRVDLVTAASKAEEVKTDEIATVSIYPVIMEAIKGEKQDLRVEDELSTTDSGEISFTLPPKRDCGAAAAAVEREEHSRDGSDDDQQEFEVDNSARLAFSKKSRLEMKREARKNKKAARKRDKLARVAVKVIQQEDQDVALPVDADDLPVETVDDDEDEDDAMSIAGEDTPRSGQESGALSPELILLETDSRRLTKKEKKREERRLLNILKKKEKHDSKLKCASMEYLSRKEQIHSLMQNKKHLESAIELTKLEMTNKGDFELYIWRRDCYLALGKIKNAIKDASQAVKLMKSVENHQALLRLQLATGNVKEARQTFEALGEDAAKEDVWHLEKIENGFRDVRNALNAEDWVRSLDFAVQLEGHCSHSDQLQLMKAEAQLHLHIYPDAIAILKKFKHELKNELPYHFVQAVSEYYFTPWWQNDEQGLLNTFDRCRHLFPRAAKIHDRAQSMRKIYKKVQLMIKKNGSNATTKQLLKTSIVLDPNNLAFMAEIHCLMAMQQDNDDDRLNDLNMSLRMKETYQAYLERGNVYRSKLKYEEALSDYESAHQIRPNCPHLQRLLEQTRRNISASHLKRNVKNDLYAVLGVTHSASSDEIKKAFHLKAKEYHPDRHVSATLEVRAENERKMKAVNKAYSVLHDKRRRSLYDQQRKRSASSDVDQDFSDDDYECYNSSDDEASGNIPEDFLADFFFSKIFFAAAAASAFSPSDHYFGGKGRNGRTSNK